jgi:hypothetical protein
MSPKDFSVGLDTNIETRVLVGHLQYYLTQMVRIQQKSSEVDLLQMETQKIDFLWISGFGKGTRWWF